VVLVLLVRSPMGNVWLVLSLGTMQLWAVFLLEHGFDGKTKDAIDVPLPTAEHLMRMESLR
jgi:hypothetical protein